jgi:antirestriction protein ArdC
MGNKIEDQEAIKVLNEAVLASMLKSKGKSWTPPFVGRKGLGYNMFTNHTLTGGNQIIAMFLGEDDRWATFGALKKNGLRWKKGSKAVTFIRPIIVTKDKKTGQLLKDPIFVGFTTYPMINGSDIEGIHEEENKEEITLEERHLKIDKVVASLGIDIRHSDRGECFYSLKEDYVHMPNKENFKTVDAYYSVLFHEIAHATKQKSRLDRDEKNYAFEELIAELSSMYLSVHFGISFGPTKDNATYLNSWIEALGNDEAYIWKASTKAMKIVNYVLKDREEKLKKAA